jgi:sulfatase maturation enzyme AslB (radical SAM superfamily)
VSDTPSLFARAEAVRPVLSIGSPGLPVFRDTEPHRSVFYTPGCVCTCPAENAEAFAARLASDDTGWSGALRQAARTAVRERTRLAERRFQPECLTVCLNNACNLSCTYCHSEPDSKAIERLTLDAIAAGAEWVARCCRDQQRPMYAVFHGGGEPLLERRRCEAALRAIQAAAARSGVALVTYVATNGVMPAERARWMADNFDRVGVSCDGPPEWQDRQRPGVNGGGTSAIVERTARIVREHGAKLLVRTTITRAGFDSQAEIARYVLERLAPDEFVLEPIYAAGRGLRQPGCDGADAPAFVRGYQEVRRLAREQGVGLESSVHWLSAQHGPHCQILRQVLNLVPGDVATACFKRSRGSDVVASGMAIGRYQPAGRRLSIDERRIDELRPELLGPPSRCRECFNQFHCGGLCPDSCPLDPARSERTRDGLPPASEADGFRCRVQRALAWMSIEEAAPGWPTPEAGGCDEAQGVSGVLLGGGLP